MLLLWLSVAFGGSYCVDGSYVPGEGVVGAIQCTSQVKWNTCLKDARNKYDYQNAQIQTLIDMADYQHKLFEQTQLVCLTLDGEKLYNCKTQALSYINVENEYLSQANQLLENMPSVLDEARKCYWADYLARQKAREERKRIRRETKKY